MISTFSFGFLHTLARLSLCCIPPLELPIQVRLPQISLCSSISEHTAAVQWRIICNRPDFDDPDLCLRCVAYVICKLQTAISATCSGVHAVVNASFEHAWFRINSVSGSWSKSNKGKRASCWCDGSCHPFSLANFCLWSYIGNPACAPLLAATA